MCDTCGCGKPDGFVIHDPNHTHSHDSDYTHDHQHEHDHPHKKVIDLNIDILSPNNITAGIEPTVF